MNYRYKRIILTLVGILLYLPSSVYGQSLTNPRTSTPFDAPLQIPQNYEKELENLLEKWYDGYARKGTSFYLNQKPQENVPVPNVPDSVYIQRLDKIPSALRLSYNTQVREAIELYLYKRRKLLSMMLNQADLYFPEIEVALDRTGLPLELKYLTIVESALTPSAVSPAGASGLWQLMLPTGKIYGLNINSLIDERFDPIRSTEAACRLLKDLYRIYNDWWLAIAAYNCGPGTVNRAISRAGGNKANFWAIYDYLPRETRRYIPLFIGAYYAMYYHNEYGIKPREVGQLLSTEYYQVKEALTFDKISELTGLEKDVIKAFNPQYRRGIIPGNTSTCLVRLPISAIAKLDNQRDKVVSPELAVKIEEDAGQKKKSVAGAGAEATEEVASSPEKENEEPSVTSKKKTAKEKKKEAKEKKNAQKGGTSYKVRKGDTLESIARRHGMKVQELKKRNNLHSDKISIGQKLVVK